MKDSFNKFFFNGINKETEAVINDYLSDCRAQGLTKATIEGYSYKLKSISLIIYNRFENKSILKMTKKNFRDLQIILQDELKLSNSSINARFGPLSSCLDYVEVDDDIWKWYSKNPLGKTKRLPRKPVKEKIFISRKEVKLIVDSLLNQSKFQEALMVSMAFDTAARVSELIQIKKEGILDGNTTNKIIRKGQKKKSKLMFMNDTKKIIKKWLEIRGNDEVETLFIATKGRAMYRGFFAKVISESGQIIGKKISTHVLRRSRAETLKRGEDERFNFRKFEPREIQIILGHDNLGTTQFYLKDDTEEIFNKMLSVMK